MPGDLVSRSLVGDAQEAGMGSGGIALFQEGRGAIEARRAPTGAIASAVRTAWAGFGRAGGHRQAEGKQGNER